MNEGESVGLPKVVEPFDIFWTGSPHQTEVTVRQTIPERKVSTTRANKTVSLPVNPTCRHPVVVAIVRGLSQPQCTLLDGTSTISCTINF